MGEGVAVIISQWRELSDVQQLVTWQTLACYWSCVMCTSRVTCDQLRVTWHSRHVRRVKSRASDWPIETCTALSLADNIQALECSWSKFPWKQISSVSFDFEMRVAFVRLFWKFHKPLKCLSKHCRDPKNVVKCNNYCLLMVELRGWTRAAQCDKKSEKCL